MQELLVELLRVSSLLYLITNPLVCPDKSRLHAAFPAISSHQSAVEMKIISNRVLNVK